MVLYKGESPLVISEGVKLAVLVLCCLEKVFLGYAMLSLLLGFLLLGPTLHKDSSKLKRVKIGYIGLSSSEEEIFC